MQLVHHPVRNNEYLLMNILPLKKAFGTLMKRVNCWAHFILRIAYDTHIGDNDKIVRKKILHHMERLEEEEERPSKKTKRR